MSTALAHSAEFDARARYRVTLALNGSVMTALMGLVPELAGLPRASALEIVLSDCGLLHRCFLAFRAHRERFRNLLLDRRNLPVDSDNALLSCGRSVNQVVAMIVRSAAKRHFRLRLDRRPGWSGRSRLEPHTALGWTSMVEWVAGRPPPIEKSAADQLYDAIRQYLLHDWQVPIIPQYARMSPPEVRAMGSRILDFRDAGELAGYLDGGIGWQPEPEPAQPVAVAEAAPEPKIEPMPAPPLLPEAVIGGASLPGASLWDGRASLRDILSPDGRSLRMERLIPILVRPEIKAALGQPDQPALLRASKILADTGPGTVRRLAVDFGLPVEQMTVMLTAAALALPQPVFERLFGRHGEAALVLALVQRARNAGLAPDSSPAAFGGFMRDLFGRFKR